MNRRMWTQVAAILVDAYREMNSRKMFWIVLILSALVMGAFATLGVNDQGMTFLWHPLSEHNRAGATVVYKLLFSYVVIGFYLTWVAAILALISTASIFPDFMTGGSIDLYLSKPIGRGRLFLVKYLSGLLFVALQVSVFAAASFLVLGWRGHTWEPSLFLAIPIVVLFFSYLYGICVLFGVMTRSTIAALMLTILAWFFIWGLDQVDKWATQQADAGSPQRQMDLREVDTANARIAAMEKQVAADRDEATRQTHDAELKRLRNERDLYLQEEAQAAIPGWLPTTQKVVVGIKTFVPKTRETLGLLDRYLLPKWEMEKAMVGGESEGRGRSGPMRWRNPTPGRSAWWVVGTSLAFEAACVGLGFWIFRRRDY